MAVAVLYRVSRDVARTKRIPVSAPSSCPTRVRINPSCVARPDDAAARDAQRMHRLREERLLRRSPAVKRRRRDGKRNRESVDDGNGLRIPPAGEEAARGPTPFRLPEHGRTPAPRKRNSSCRSSRYLVALFLSTAGRYMSRTTRRVSRKPNSAGGRSNG
jgi:hypothetical protein